MDDTLFDMPSTTCPQCGRPLDNGDCVWCSKGRVRRDAMDTSRAAAASPSIPNNKQRVAALLIDHPGGLTDMQLEELTGGTHQSISAARRALVIAGLVEDSGERLLNERGNKAAVWRWVSPDRKAKNDRDDSPDSGSLLDALPPRHPLADVYDGGDILDADGSVW